MMKKLLVISLGMFPIFAFAQIVTWTETLNNGPSELKDDAHYEVANVSESTITVTRPSGSHTWYRMVTGSTDSPASPNSYYGYLHTLGQSTAAYMSWSSAQISIPTLNYYHYGHKWAEQTVSDSWDRAYTALTGGTTHTTFARTGTGLGDSPPEVDEFTKPYVTSGGSGGGAE